MEKLTVCQICKNNLSSQSCKFCGRKACLNCSKNGICKACIQKL